MKNIHKHTNSKALYKHSIFRHIHAHLTAFYNFTAEFFGICFNLSDVLGYVGICMKDI